MSGPKTSRYRVSVEQLRRIREEQERLQKELEKKVREEREYRKAKEYLAEVDSRIDRQMGMLDSKESGAVTEGVIISKKAEEEKRRFMAVVTKIRSICHDKELNSHAHLMSARDQVETLLREALSLSNDLMESFDSLVIDHRISEDKKIADSMQISFASIGVLEEQADPTVTKTIDMLDELLVLDISDELRTEVIAAKETYLSIEDPEAAKTFRAISIEPMRKRCIEADRFANEKGSEFYHLQDEYRVLCEQLDEKEMQISFSDSGLSELQKKVDIMRCRLEEKAQQAYISRCIDEVMQEMGYRTVGQRNVRKKSGKTFKSRLLTYGDGTVINVTESPNGQITMEVGGIDDKDRLPDSNERVSLQKTMESFCRDYKTIEQHLADKGVLLNERLSMAPPDGAYAQIINYTDYDLEESVRISDIRKKKEVVNKNSKLTRNG